MSAEHLVTVWNPLYTSDVDQHFALLLDWARRNEEGKVSDDDVYVWWGKVRSSNRLQPMKNADQVRRMSVVVQMDATWARTVWYFTRPGHVEK